MDNLNDGITAPLWTVISGTNLSLAETAAGLTITFGGNVPAAQQAGYVTTNTMDLTGRCLTVELTAVPR